MTHQNDRHFGVQQTQDLHQIQRELSSDGNISVVGLRSDSNSGHDLDIEENNSIEQEVIEKECDSNNEDLVLSLDDNSVDRIEVIAEKIEDKSQTSIKSSNVKK